MSRQLAAIAAGFEGVFAIDETGAVQGCVPSIAEELKARGVIYAHTDGCWHLRTDDPEIVARQFAWMAVCDVCSARPVTWTADVADFELGDHSESVGGWAACEACGTAIAAGDRPALLRRALAASRGRRGELEARVGPLPHAQLDAFIRDTHARLWRHYRSIQRLTPQTFGH